MIAARIAPTGTVMNHDRMMNAIHEIFDPALPRLAPGDDAVTRRALDLLFPGGLGRLPADFRVLDVGCGNGTQTLCLARELDRPVTAPAGASGRRAGGTEW